MQPPFPSPVPTWHQDAYAAISPQRPELSCTGKTVIITGAGSGIGRETAEAFAEAGAKCLVLIGRTASTLIETKRSLNASHHQVGCSVFPADVTDELAMRHIATEVGTWDILILNAGYLPTPAPVASSSVADAWKSYETNVKSVMIASVAFIPTGHDAHAAIIGVAAGALVFPPANTPGLSAYLTSKMAMVKMLEFVAMENPNVFVASMHPGMVDTGIFQKSGAKPEMMPMDTVTLSAHSMVWLASPEATFLRGKLVWANWDVEELKRVGSELQSNSKMTVGVEGWPFAQMT